MLPCYQHQLAENVADLVLAIGRDYSHILAAATTHGKNFLPRVAALLDVAQISDVIAVEAAEILLCGRFMQVMPLPRCNQLDSY